MIDYTVHVNEERTDWYLNGKRHRVDGPAIEYANGDNWWFLNGLLHREDGPAIERVDGNNWWYLNGQFFTEAAFNEKLKPTNDLLIYLAAPYSHTNKNVTHNRMEKIYSVIGEYAQKGIHVTTPMFMHEIVVRQDIAGDYAFWEKYCLNILKRCDKMIILKLEGWDTSRGVIAEIEFCKQHNIPVEYIDC